MLTPTRNQPPEYEAALKTDPPVIDQAWQAGEVKGLHAGTIVDHVLPSSDDCRARVKPEVAEQPMERLNWI